MDHSESARLTQVELWQGRHEEGCKGRHEAIKLRLDHLDTIANEVKQDLSINHKSQQLIAWLRVIGLAAIMLAAPHLDLAAVAKLLGLLH